MLIKALWRYVAGHWSGTHGLAWSFWINFVLIRAMVFALQGWLGPEQGHDYQDSRVLVIILAVFMHGILFVWQAVGVVRASDGYLRASGAMAVIWGTQISLVVAFLLVLTYALGAWQMTLPVPDSSGIQSDLEAERKSKYSIEPTSDGRSLMLTGSLELGITSHLKNQLKAYPNAEQIVLASNGGNIYEARGLSKVIGLNGLNTLVTSDCSSSCTIVFIGGNARQLAPSGRLGFHQYRIDANYTVLNADPLLEQKRDQAIFQKAGVAPWFLDKMFESPPSKLWFPELSELIRARVVTSVAP